MSVCKVSVKGDVSVWGSLCTGCLCPGGGGLCPGGLCPGRSVSGRPPPLGYMLAVRILLHVECILVQEYFLQCLAAYTLQKQLLNH